MYRSFVCTAKLRVCPRQSGGSIVLIIANKKTPQSETFGCIERSIVRVQHDGKFTPTGISAAF